MPSLFRSFTLAGILAGSLAGTVSAQDAGDESSTVIYTADYFDQVAAHNRSRHARQDSWTGRRGRA